MISHYDIICIQVYITPWYHIWYPNHQTMISHMISQLCDITVWLWYHSQTMISHMMSCMYIMWCSSTSYMMSWVISHCDITIMWYHRETLWYHMWNHRQQRDSSYVISHSFFISYVISHMTSQSCASDITLWCHMW